MKLLHFFLRQTGTRPIHVTIPKRYTYFWEIAAFLSQQEDVEMTSLDCLDPSHTAFALAKKIFEERPEVLVLLVRIENLQQTVNFCRFMKSIDPSLNILVYGDLVNLLPDFFEASPLFDAVVIAGDWEAAIMSYVKYLQHNNDPVGVYVRKLGKRFAGVDLQQGWSFPDVTKIPLELYSRLDGKRQLTFTVARGCPYNCRFCLSTCTFGIKDRRAPVDAAIRYMERAAGSFESFKLFAPTFNVDNEWVREFCRKLIERNAHVRWCATSRIDLLDDEDLVALMARAGCYKISVGLETINRSSKYLNKEFPREKIIRVADLFRKNGIILKGLIMLGIPYQTKQDVLELFRLMREHDITIRPTSYSPLDELKQLKNPSVEDILAYDKFTYYQYGIEGVTREQYYRLLLFPDDFETILA